MTTATLKHTYLGQSLTAGQLIQKTLHLVDSWVARAAQRRQLAGLSAERLDDIGISRAAALEEAARPFWSE